MTIFSEYSDYIVFALGLLISFVVTRLLPRKRKSLSYFISNVSHIFEKSKSMESSGLEVRFQGEPIDYVETISLKFINDGETEIIISDFFEPIKVQFDQGVTLLAIKASMDSLFETSQLENVFQFKLDLINPKESITIDFTINKRSKLKVVGRIKGVSKFQPSKKFHTIGIFVKLIFGIGLLAIVFYGVLIAHIYKILALGFFSLLLLWAVVILLDIRKDLKGQNYDYAYLINI